MRKNRNKEPKTITVDFTGKSKFIKIAVLVICALVIILGSFYSVGEQEQAVVTQFGKVVATNTAGLYFKIPFIQNVHKVDMTTHGIGIGYSIDGGQNITVEEEGIMITSDFNFVDIDFYMEYKVSDPVAYLYNSRNPENVMKNIAMASIRSTVIDYTVDEVITTGKSQIQADVKELLTNELTKQNIGLQVVNISVQDAEPPTDEIIAAFKAVETAKQSKETKINNANQYKSEQIPAAEASADAIVQSAEASKSARIAEAEGEVAKFNAMYEEYIKYPLITKKRLFYETIEAILPNAKIVITDGKTQEMLPLDDFATSTGASSQTTNTGDN